MLEEEATLLEGAEEFQVAGSKHKNIAAGDEERQQPSKKAKGKQPEKYHRGAIVKIEVLTPVRGVWALDRIAWYTLQGEYFLYLLLFFLK